MQRIQKVLAHLGYGSRRQVEHWIREGKIKLNGHMAHLGDRVDLNQDQLYLNGKLVQASPNAVDPQIILYHKPPGELCTRRDPHGRRTVFHALPKPISGRWIYVGRLDINTSGLLLLTTDGELAHRLMHPSQQIAREYVVRILGQLTDKHIKKLTHGITLDDGAARFEHIVETETKGVNHWYRVVVMEGRNRLVRRLFESVGFSVNRLIRVRFGSIVLPKNLRLGHYQKLSMSDFTKTGQFDKLQT